MTHDNYKIEEAIRLRTTGKMSLSEIRDITGISKSTLSVLLRDYPLTRDEKIAKNTEKRLDTLGKRKTPVVESEFHRVVANTNLSSSQKGRISEAAILFRLVLRGFSPLRPIFDGSKSDWIVQTPSGKGFIRIQVKTINHKSKYSPTMRVVCADGRTGFRSYRDCEIDYIIGYDLYTDSAYVYSLAEIGNRTKCLTVKEDAAEAWEKIREL